VGRDTGKPCKSAKVRPANESGGDLNYVELDISAVTVEDGQWASSMTGDVASANAVDPNTPSPASPCLNFGILQIMNLLGIVYAIEQEHRGSTCGYCSPSGQRSREASSFHDAQMVAASLDCEVNHQDSRASSLEFTP